MIQELRNLIGTYQPYTGTGVETINWEYLTCCILLIVLVWFLCKAFLSLLFRK